MEGSKYNQRVRSIEDNIQTLDISEPFEEGVQLRRSRLKIVVLHQGRVKVRKTLLKKG
jgi:hypothetical protein